MKDGHDTAGAGPALYYRLVLRRRGNWAHRSPAAAVAASAALE